ncbi:hypothetical protein A0J61_00081 [Choanephora cucurbitarum]|uniref:Uncharacterized protein n=1 Tax=Choanephora cucurbitarum TaxID=101091 RepID=A0A1C7NS86_9FUNG|nr:hypothetical protein A0J61_00081 [Choanephora cucurbitarum]
MKSGSGHHIPKENYPEITNNMTTMLNLQPGDTVFCTCFLYVSSVCPANSNYIKLQRDAFLTGLAPPDSPGNHCEEKAKGRARPDDLNEQARHSMGFTKLPEVSLDAKKNQ